VSLDERTLGKITYLGSCFATAENRKPEDEDEESRNLFEFLFSCPFLTPNF